MVSESTAPVADHSSDNPSEARIMLAVYTGASLAVLLGYPEPLLYWFLPMVLAQPFWRGWLLAEHTGCEHNDDIYANTPTTRADPITRTVLWQMPDRLAHHAYPAIPCFAPGRARALIASRAPRAEHQCASYLAWIKRLVRTRTPPGDHAP